jgi:peptidoglycan hydrolase-like protein with peptidoglycan-binding domain
MSRRRATGVIAGVLSVGAVAAAVTVLRLPAAESGEGGKPTLPAETAEITKETLVDRSDHDGTLGHGDTTTISARAAGTVTTLPAAGATVSRGKSIYRIDNKPVTLLYGALPAYRTLSPGVTGADVKQFEKNLWALGYRGFTVDTKYSSSTATAVKEWQDDLGLTETGRVETSQIVYATSPVRVDSRTAQVGAVVQPGSEILDVTGTARVATVQLDVDDQRLARMGAAVKVTMPDGSVANGKITGVESTVIPATQQEDAQTKIVVTIGFAGAPKAMDDSSVTASFVASERPDVLTVPVAALLALAEGGYGIQVVDGVTTRIVAVQTGLFADGKVEVSGDGLTAGMKVGMPS